MTRRKEAPAGMECPYRHQCPHLEGLSSSWVMQVYQEAFDLRQQVYSLQQDYQQRIEALEKTLLERDAKIAQLQLQHRKQFKANVRPPASPSRSARRGAPVGHPPWRRREPDHIDQTIEVPAPSVCPHCHSADLRPHEKRYEHTQEDVVLVPRTRVTRFLHRQSWCPRCRQAVYQAGEGELPGCQIGPLTRAVATHLRYDLQIPYRKTRHILQDLFGMPLVPASAMAFDRKVTLRGRPLYEELRVKLQSSSVAYADETGWREDGHGRYVWYGGHQHLAFFQITDNRSSDSALSLLGEDFDGALVTDAYAAYNAVHARHRQTCWSHIASTCKDLLEQIRLTDPAIDVPRSVRFLEQVKRLASDLCALGRQLRDKTLKLSNARAKIPSLQKRLRAIAGKPLDYAPAETLRQRLMYKDADKLFTFLRIAGVEPTNNHSERSVRPLVIMRKICNGTRSADGSESHGVLPSLLQTAQRQGTASIPFLMTLNCGSLDAARAMLLPNSS
jgi:transposase